MELIIELVGRGSRQFDLQRVAGERITIGRAFDNDIILSDPHVCAHHAVLEENEKGEILLKDLGSINGSFTKDHVAVNEACVVSSGDEFVLGKTRIQIYQRDHKVAPSIRLTWLEQLAFIASKPSVLVSIIAGAVILSLFYQYANDIKSFHPGRYLVTLISVLLVGSFWPAVWALFARMKKHDARVVAQLSATMLFVIVVTLLQKTDKWLAFHFGTGMMLEIFESVLIIALAFLLIWMNYYLSIFQTSRKRWIYAMSLTAILSGLTYMATSFNDDRFKSRPMYNTTLYPPSMTFYSGQSINEYLRNTDNIFDEAVSLIDDAADTRD